MLDKHTLMQVLQLTPPPAPETAREGERHTIRGPRLVAQRRAMLETWHALALARPKESSGQCQP